MNRARWPADEPACIFACHPHVRCSRLPERQLGTQVDLPSPAALGGCLRPAADISRMTGHLLLQQKSTPSGLPSGRASVMIRVLAFASTTRTQPLMYLLKKVYDAPVLFLAKQ